MNSVSSLKELQIRIEKMYTKKIEEITTQNGKNFNTVYGNLENLFLSSFFASDVVVENMEIIFKVYFKENVEKDTKTKLIKKRI